MMTDAVGTFETVFLTPEETAERLRSVGNSLIFCHAHPDGDTLGAAYGLRAILTMLGKRAYCVRRWIPFLPIFIRKPAFPSISRLPR